LPAGGQATGRKRARFFRSRRLPLGVRMLIGVKSTAPTRSDHFSKPDQKHCRTLAVPNLLRAPASPSKAPRQFQCLRSHRAGGGPPLQPLRPPTPRSLSPAREPFLSRAAHKGQHVNILLVPRVDFGGGNSPTGPAAPPPTAHPPPCQGHRQGYTYLLSGKKQNADRRTQCLTWVHTTPSEAITIPLSSALLPPNGTCSGRRGLPQRDRSARQPSSTVALQPPNPISPPLPSCEGMRFPLASSQDKS